MTTEPEAAATGRQPQGETRMAQDESGLRSRTFEGGTCPSLL